MSNDEIQMTNNQTSSPAEGLPAVASPPKADPPLAEAEAGWGRKEKTLTWLNVFVMVIIALAILVAVSYISQRRYFRIDCTFKQEYSISDKSKEILKQIKEPIIIYTFFLRPEDPRQQDPIVGEVQRMMMDLLEEYKIYSQGKITVEAIQPAVNPEMVEILQKKFNLETIAPNDMILRYGDNQKNVNLVETFERDEGPYGRSGGLKEFRGEESLTSAIKTIIQPKKTVVYFTTGHNEGDITNATPDGYSTFLAYLQRENIESKPLSLLGITRIPADCSALVILGPKKPISPPERNLLNDYLKAGGRALIMIDPMAEHGLAELLTDWGIKSEEGMVIDPEKCVAFFGMKDVTCMVVEDYPRHPITEKMRTEPSVIPGARPIESISPTIATEIIKSSPHSWLETDLDGLAKGHARFDKDADRKGPIPLGVAASKNENSKEARLVVLGDSDMVRNKLIDANSIMGVGRVDLVLNSIRWLSGQESFISIEPKKVESKRIELSGSRPAFLFWFSLLIVPSIGVLFGIAMWLIRRK